MSVAQILALAFVLLVGVVALAAAPWAVETPAPADSSGPTTEALRLGERVYMKNCATCHRADGKGGRQPTATGDPVPSFRDTAFWRGKTDEALRKATEEGVPNTSMVAWKGVLSAGDITAVTRFVRHRFGPKESAAPAAPGSAPADAASRP